MNCTEVVHFSEQVGFVLLMRRMVDVVFVIQRCSGRCDLIVFPIRILFLQSIV